MAKYELTICLQFNSTHIDVDDDVSFGCYIFFSSLLESVYYTQFAGFCCCLLISQYDSDLIDDEEKNKIIILELVHSNSFPWLLIRKPKICSVYVCLIFYSLDDTNDDCLLRKKYGGLRNLFRVFKHFFVK